MDTIKNNWKSVATVATIAVMLAANGLQAPPKLEYQRSPTYEPPVPRSVARPPAEPHADSDRVEQVEFDTIATAADRMLMAREQEAKPGMPVIRQPGDPEYADRDRDFERLLLSLSGNTLDDLSPESWRRNKIYKGLHWRAYLRWRGVPYEVMLPDAPAQDDVQPRPAGVDTLRVDQGAYR